MSSDFDNGFKKAQRSYDSQESPDFYRETCRKCRGDGEIEDDKTGEPIVCPNCQGDGEV